MRKALILDTSLLCAYLQVPGKETCGPADDRWGPERVTAKIEQARQQGATLVLPLATVVETGNHIAQAPRERYERAQALVQIITEAADARSPWAALDAQAAQWGGASLKESVAPWPQDAARGLSLGDALILRVAALYAELGFHVELLTGDCQLKSLEPPPPRLIPRRRGG